MKYALPLTLLLLCGGAFLFGQGIRFNATASMPPGLYRLVPGVPKRGDPVGFCLHDATFEALARDRGYLRPGSCPDGLQPLCKVVVGVPGDVVALAPDGIRINGRLQPDSLARAKDSHGRPLPPAALHAGRIPSGMALVLSDDHPGGFDGRYFGLVPIKSLQRVLMVKPMQLFDSKGGN